MRQQIRDTDSVQVPRLLNTEKWNHIEMKTLNRRTALTLTALAFLCLGIALPSSDAFGQQKSLKELIVGTWLLDSVYDQTQDGEKHNPWGDGVKGQAIFTSDGNVSWQMMSANRPKADTSPREPVGPVVTYWGTYTVDEAAKTLTDHLERCTFPQWDGITGTLNLASLTENELDMTTTKPIPDPKMGPFVPHINWRRASTPSNQ
jgi:hypothetical protein